MSNSGVQERRVYPPKKFDDLLNKIVLEEGLFSTRAKAMVFAAALGFSRDASDSDWTRGEGIRFELFERAGDEKVFDLLAVAKARDLNVLGDDSGEVRIKTFEAYVAGGLGIFATRIEREHTAREAALSLLREAREKDAETSPDGVSAGTLKTLLGD